MTRNPLRGQSCSLRNNLQPGYTPKPNAYFLEGTKYENNGGCVFRGEVKHEDAQLGEEDTGETTQRRRAPLTGCAKNTSFVGRRE